MTQDEIIRMAREAGFNVHPRKNTISSKECLCDETLNELLERFAALVAANERNRHAWTQEHWTEYEHTIAAAEREACAKVCEADELCCKCGDECAAAIRNRGTK